MLTQWLRRAWLAAAGASVLLLAACGGGGDVESALSPSRIVVFGDAMADVGQNAAGTRYTVNDGSVNNWTQVLANAYSLPMAPARLGGTSYATGNARVAVTPGAGNDAGAPSLVQQIDAFLAAGGVRDNDLIVVNIGHSDIIVEMRAFLAKSRTEADALAALGTVGTQLGQQVRRLVNAGARHVLVAGVYNLGRGAWAKETGEQTLMEQASRQVNEKFKLEAANLGEKVLFVDFAGQVNLYEGNQGQYGFSNVTDPVCTSRDAGEGIGTGLNEVDSSECTTGTLVSSSYDTYLFADRVYLTPRAQRNLGDYALAILRNRW